MNSGDGAVAGQSEQEDRFYFFFREDMEAVLSAWNAMEGTGSVLDRVEESYRAFSDANHQSGCPGLDSLQEEVNRAIAQNRWSADQNAEEITAWIRQYLVENYRYQQNLEPVPDGKDALAYFLLESKTGNSVHFASTAVILYRMFGIPARYVVGYEVPASLFSVQSNGTYTATVQGDQAQAWAEIYVPGIGWMPRDMTPGVIGTYEEVGPGGEQIEVFADEGSQTDAGAQETQAGGEDSPLPDSGGRHIREDSQIILVLLRCVSVILTVAGLAFAVRYFCRIFGYDPFHRYSRQQLLTFVFQALYSRMRRLGLPRSANSQSEEFLSFCETELNRRCPEAACLLRPAVEKLYRSCFGGEPASREDIAAMRRLLLASYGAAE